MPDDAAPLLRCAALQDALDAVAHGAVLLVARQLLHEPPALVLEHDEVPQDVEEDGGIEQAGDEPRLPLGRGAEATLELALGEGLDRLPASVGVLGRAHGAEGGIGAAVGDTQQVRVEELGDAGAVPLRPGFLVTVKLPDGLLLPDLQQRGRFRLHDNQGDAVHEQDEVGLDDALVVLAGAPGAALPAPTHAELRRDDVPVQPDAGLGVVEVEEANRRRLLAAAAVDGEGHAVGEVLVDGLVAREAGGVEVLQVEDDALRLVLGHPLVEAHERSREPPMQEHVALVVALCRQRLAGHVSPAQALQQLARGILREVELVQLGRGGHGCSASRSFLSAASRSGRSVWMMSQTTSSSMPM